MANKDFNGTIMTAFLGVSPEIDPGDYPAGSYVLIKCDDAVRVSAGEVTVVYNEPTENIRADKDCGNCAVAACSPMLMQSCKMFGLFNHWTPGRGDQ